jgi:hypothetical protein
VSQVHVPKISWCGTLRKKSFSARGYDEIHIQRPFFDDKHSIWKCGNTKISIFGGISKFHLWAVLGIFGQILLHWQWLTACPNLGWNLKYLITFEPSHWKATIHIYNLKKFQKIQKFIAFTSACPESLNPTYGSPKPLGVKMRKEPMFWETIKKPMFQNVSTLNPIIWNSLKSASHYNRGVERTLDKLPSRGQGRSPLKYINCRLFISLERNFCSLVKSLGFHKYCEQVFLYRTNYWCQNSQKVLPCRHFGGPCPLAIGF